LIEAHEDLINNSLLVCLVEGREKKRIENGKRNEKEKKRKYVFGCKGDQRNEFLGLYFIFFYLFKL